MKCVIAMLFFCLFCYECFSQSKIDYKTATGDEIVEYCMSKKGGFTNVQFDYMEDMVTGRKLTFSEGVLQSAQQDYKGAIILNVEYSQPSATGGKLFTIMAVVTEDQEIQKAKNLCLRKPVRRISGMVKKLGCGSLCLTDVRIVAKGNSNNNEYDNLKTGDQVSRYYSSKGWTSVQEKEFFDSLIGKTFVFRKMTVHSVYKNECGNVIVELGASLQEDVDSMKDVDSMSDAELEASAAKALKNLKNLNEALKTGRAPLRIYVICKTPKDIKWAMNLDEWEVVPDIKVRCVEKLGGGGFLWALRVE